MSNGGQPGGQGGEGGQGGGGQQPAAPWSSVGEGQIWTIGDKPWYETAVPEGPARELMRSKRYANPAIVANSYYELDRINASRDDSKMIRIPDPDAKAEDWNAVYEKLGRPKDPAGYNEVKWGNDADPGMVDFGKSLAFKLGLSPKAVESIMVTEWNNFVTKMNQTGVQQQEQTNNQALAEIKATWKGDYAANLARGQQVLQALDKAGFSDADLASVEKAVGIPAVVKLLATIGKLSGEGNLMSTGGGGGQTDPASMTPEQAKSEITRLTADKDFQKTYMGEHEPGHKDAVTRMEVLYRKAGSLMGGAAVP